MDNPKCTWAIQATSFLTCKIQENISDFFQYYETVIVSIMCLLWKLLWDQTQNLIFTLNKSIVSPKQVSSLEGIPLTLILYALFFTVTTLESMLSSRGSQPPLSRSHGTCVLERLIFSCIIWLNLSKWLFTYLVISLGPNPLAPLTQAFSLSWVFKGTASTSSFIHSSNLITPLKGITQPCIAFHNSNRFL